MNKSVVVRYGDHVKGVSKEFIKRASISEDAQILGPVLYKETPIHLLDLSSKSPTGTFKDWLAVVTIAYCLEQGIKEFVTQTSGNTGNALVRYAEAHGIKVHVFYPRDSSYKIQPQVAELSRSEFYEMECGEPELKARTAEFARERGLRWLPTFDHQMQANKLRAYLIQEWSERTGVRFDWHVQALSSAYGIFGFYRGLQELREQGHEIRFPKLLGGHQSAVAPYYNFLYDAQPQPQEQVLEPTLFRTKPTQELLEELRSICWQYGGVVARVSKSKFAERVDDGLRILDELGMKPRLSPITGDFSEKAPLIALISLLDQIDLEVVAPGENALVVATGGFGAVPAYQFKPGLKSDCSEAA